MEPELLQAVEGLVVDDGDTLAGAEMLLSTMVALVRDAPSNDVAQSVCAATRSFCHSVIFSTMPGTAAAHTPVPHNTEGAASSLGASKLDSLVVAVQQALADLQRSCEDSDRRATEFEATARAAMNDIFGITDATKTASVAPPRLHPADPRELMTAITTIVHAQGVPPEKDGFGDSEGFPNQASSPTSWNASLVALPTLCSLMQQALGALLCQAWRRNEQRSSATTPVIVLLHQSLASVVAWMPQVLQSLRFCLSLASQQDGDVQYVDLDDSTQRPTPTPALDHHSELNSPRDPRNDAATYITPRIIARTMFAEGGLAEASLSLIFECSRLIEAHVACNRLLLLLHRNATPVPAQAAPTSSNASLLRELFMTLCSLRLSLVTAACLDGEGAGECHRTPFVIESLEAMVADCEERDVASRHQNLGSQHRRPNNDARTMLLERHREERGREDHVRASSYADSSAPLAHHPSLDRLLAETESIVLRLCSTSASSSFMHLAAAQLHDIHAARSGDGSAQRRFDVLSGCMPDDGSPLSPLLALYVAWATAAADTASQGFGDAADTTQTKHHRPSAIVQRLRDAALHAFSMSSEMTESDERLAVTQRMQRCAALEDALAPCILVSDSDEELEDDIDGPDSVASASGPHEQCCLPYEGLAGASLVCGALLMTLDVLSRASTAASDNGALFDGVVSTIRLAELSCVHPVRFLLRSKSLAAQSLGLRLWHTLLARVPKYQMDFPGEVRLTTIVGSDADSMLDDGTEGAHGSTRRTVEAMDLLLPIGNAQTAVGKGGVFRTNRFARHYYAFQDLVSMVVVNPSTHHRLAAKHLVSAALQWYVAPIRCKLLCHLLYTSPYGAIACALLLLLKDEVMAAYRPPPTVATVVAGSTTTTGHNGEVGCFLNVAVLEHIYGMLLKWTRTTIPVRTDVSSRVSLAVGNRQSEYVECTAVALNLVLAMLREDIRRATACVAAEDGVDKLRGSRSQQGLLFALVAHADGRPRIHVASVSPVANHTRGVATRMQSSGEFVALLRRDILQPWKRLCGEVLSAEAPASTPPSIGLVDAFSIDGLVDGIERLLA